MTGVDTRASEGEIKQDAATTAMFANAAKATEKEHKMTLMQGIKLYPKAIGWSMLISSVCAMEGYDISLIGNFYAMDQFNRKYGVPAIVDGKETYQVPARWQSGLSNGAQCGQIIGLLVNAHFTERFGYRPVILACLIWLVGVTALFAFAPNIQTLLAGEILAGLPWGIFQSIAISYASEVCPVALRQYLTTYGNICWGWGQLVGIGVIRGCLHRTDQWAYRLPYCLMWMWYPPLIIGVYFAPESPWWLVRHGRLDKARDSLLRLTTVREGDNFDVDETIDMMVHTTELEKDITTGSSFTDCFKGTDLRRTELVCAIWATQNFSGNSFSNYSTYFFTQGGLAPETSYDFAMGQYAINVVFTCVGWGIMALGVGRRRLFLCGLCGLFLTLLAMGFLGFMPKTQIQERGMATGALIIVWACFYQSSVGSIAFSLVAEMSTRRLQIKTVALGRAAFNIVAIICNVLSPYMINPTAWNWGNFSACFWAGTCLCCLVYHYFRLPEPAGRTFAELDILFERRVPARQFKHAQVNAFDVALHHQVEADKPNLEHIEQVEHVEKPNIV